MNQHLSQEELILAYYGESKPAHLESCEQCRTELGRLAAVLDRVTPIDVPEPDGDYETRVWNRLEWRLRGEKKRDRGAWMKWAAVAAVIVIAFAGGLLWNRRPDAQSPVQTVHTTTSTAQPPATVTTTNPAVLPAATTTIPNRQQPQQQTVKKEDAPRDRILLLVVGEHMDQSERMLVELTNITPSDDDGFDIKTERAKAEELLASNRLYRRTALDRGEGNVATLLDELEPMLMQIAHAPDDMSADELRTIQKRVETKGLVFKLRVVRADVSRKTVTRTGEPTT
jgi:hypothetical protein